MIDDLSEIRDTIKEVQKRLARSDYLEKHGKTDYYAKFYHQVWCGEHPSYQGDWLKKNPDYFKIKSKEWRQNNPDYAKEKSKKFREENPKYHKKNRRRNKRKLRKYWRERKRRERAKAKEEQLRNKED